MTQRIAIILRKSEKPNHFRLILDALLKLPKLSSALVTSGFFQEDHKFSASSIFKFPCISRNTPATITFVGVYNSLWKPKFFDFINNVTNLNCSCCVKIDSMMPKGLHWHAKVFIGSIDSKPRFGIIGSSNLTRPAADTTSFFNFEADTVLWYEDDKEVNDSIISALEQSSNPGEVLLTTYNPEDRINGNLTIGEQLQILQDQILSFNTNQ